nr:uncharacterized protein LOC109169628 [Ipomoea batatas]
MATNPHYFTLFFAALFLVVAWASQATARTLEEPSILEHHGRWMARHGRSYKYHHVKKAKRFKFLETFNNVSSTKVRNPFDPLNNAAAGGETADPEEEEEENCDENGNGKRLWVPFLISGVLFVLLQPGLIVQIPGEKRFIEFRTMKTSGRAILVHTLIFIFICVIIILIFRDRF